MFARLQWMETKIGKQEYQCLCVLRQLNCYINHTNVEKKEGSYLWRGGIKTHVQHRLCELLESVEVGAAADVIHVGLK